LINSKKNNLKIMIKIRKAKKEDLEELANIEMSSGYHKKINTKKIFSISLCLINKAE
jgi:hypothetical protein